MPRPQPPPDKIFARPPHFTVRYRRGHKLRWPGEAAPDYAVLVPLAGVFKWAGTGDGPAEKSGSEKRSASSGSGMSGPSDGASDSGTAGDSREVRTGGALLHAPNDSVDGYSVGAAACLTLALSPVYVLDCATRAGVVRAGAFVGFRGPAVRVDEKLARLARDLADELLGGEAGGGVVVGALVEQTLVHLLRRHGAAMHADQIELSRAGLIDRRVRRAVELMHAHLDRDLPLGEIAAAAYLSPFHFSRLFKKLTGATPHAYLASLRAARAQALLAETDLSVTEVGARVGYASPSHFARAFRQATGTTPRAYRQALVRR